METDQWKQAPSYDDVQTCFYAIGRLKARIKLLKSEIELSTLHIKRDNPRKPWLILEATEQQQRELTQLESELDILEADRDFYLFHKEIYKSKGYIG